MASLVLELQRAALNKETSVADLLRLAFVVARKLGVAEFETWVVLEMNGYKDGAEVPEYRKLQGTAKAFNPYSGWQPLGFADPKFAKRLSNRPIPDSIAKLEDMLAGATKSGEFMVSFIPEVEKDIMDAMTPRMQPATAISNASVQSIVDTVRNVVLDWALKLESNGVLGDDMTFSDDEKRRAPPAETPTSISYHAQNQTVIHTVQQSQIQQGTTGSTQTFVNAPLDPAAVTSLMAYLKRNLDSLGLTDEQRGEVEADIATVEAQAKSPKPRFPIIRETMHSLRAVVEQAVGGVASTAILAEFTRLLT